MSQPDKKNKKPRGRHLPGGGWVWERYPSKLFELAVKHAESRFEIESRSVYEERFQQECEIEKRRLIGSLRTRYLLINEVETARKLLLLRIEIIEQELLSAGLAIDEDAIREMEMNSSTALRKLQVEAEGGLLKREQLTGETKRQFQGAAAREFGKIWSESRSRFSLWREKAEQQARDSEQREQQSRVSPGPVVGAQSQPDAPSPWLVQTPGGGPATLKSAVSAPLTGVGDAALRVLRLLVEKMEGMAPTRSALANVCGVKSGSLSRPLSRLAAAGVVTCPRNGPVTATPAGVRCGERAGDVNARPGC